MAALLPGVELVTVLAPLELGAVPDVALLEVLAADWPGKSSGCKMAGSKRSVTPRSGLTCGADRALPGRHQRRGTNGTSAGRGP